MLIVKLGCMSSTGQWRGGRGIKGELGYIITVMGSTKLYPRRGFKVKINVRNTRVQEVYFIVQNIYVIDYKKVLLSWRVQLIVRH